MEKRPNIVSYMHPSLGLITHSLPVYPSAILTPPPASYMDAVEFLPEGTGCVFCDGETIVIAEYESELISSLVERFGAMVEYGRMREQEFATLALRAGVDGQLVLLGDQIKDWALTPAEMVVFALRAPEEARRLWSEQYQEAMDAAA